MSHRSVLLIALCFFACTGVASAQLPGLSNNPSPELVGQLTKQLSIKPEQAIGGLGTIFGFAKTKLKPDDFLKIANVVPGMDGLLKAAPILKPNANDPLSQMGTMLPGKAGAIASMGGAFKQLGMSPQMAMKFLPVMTQFLKLKGGANVAGLLGGLFK
ncbi:MAG TPA: DUF2780 domain-containing protein [Pyrinomonadaceae bacterium]|nr:DUF2780 domain-containing protein [Pyrinomonadaceae bacterium]